jgi:DNA-3-methyladenine glycosylase I
LLLHEPYHDTEYGFPVHSDDALFERLILEINQAGLSWGTILKKREAFRAAYDRFSIDAVAAYRDAAIERLLSDAGIIRNRLKIQAAVDNANRILELRQTHGSFHGWLEAQGLRTKAEWVTLFRKTFRFTGGEIVGSFLMSTGYLEGAHHPACPMYPRTIEAGANWAKNA